MTPPAVQPFDPVRVSQTPRPPTADKTRAAELAPGNASRGQPPDPPPPPPPGLLGQQQVFDAERARVRSRRTTLKIAGGGPEPDTVGVALSGGGIRSATVSLGILRSIARADLMKRIDYVSSVSGGSYVAAFLCSRYVPSAWRGDVEAMRDGAYEGGTGDPFAGDDGEHALAHLRQSGRHLLPGGAGDALRLAAITVRSWLAVHLVIGVTLVTLLTALKLPQIAWNTYGTETEADWAAGGLPPILWPSAWAHGYPSSHWFVASWLLPAALLPLFVSASLFWAYFLSRGQPGPDQSRLGRALGSPGVIGAIAVAVGGTLLACLLKPNPEHPAAQAYAAIAVAYALAALAGYGIAELADWRATRNQIVMGDDAQPITSARVQEDRVRHRLTAWTSWWLNAFLALTALGLLDSAAQTIYLRDREPTYPLSAGAALALVVPLARQLIGRFATGGEASGGLAKAIARFGQLIALLGGTLVALVVGTFWAVAAHRVAWFGGPVGELREGLWLGPTASFLLTLAALVGATVAVAISFSFLNLSTFASFYASNLRRAYLGASNVRRWREDRPASPATGRKREPNRQQHRPTPADRDHADDDVALDRYFADGVLAPVHLINVTINDTASEASSTTQRDRRGKPLAISPAGYLFPANDLRGTLLGIPLSTLAEVVGNGDRTPEAVVDPSTAPIGGEGQATSGPPRRDDATTLSSSEVRSEETVEQTPTAAAARPAGDQGDGATDDIGATDDSLVTAADEASESARISSRSAEKLPLSTWVGISGAAASTGLGQYGSVGLSLLAGLANLRLGYWWDPGPARGGRRRLIEGSVQGRLRDELLGRFPGSDGSRWYLTDGGHFENTGAYELIRRRVGLIIVCDNGADPTYDFADLVTLTRRVRIDFDAELRFIDDPTTLDRILGDDTPLRRAFGTLKQLGVAKRKARATGPYAALGRVRYATPGQNGLPGRDSTVIWIKPRVCGSEALDLVAYAKSHPPFPQQTTLDQSFSEAQWESHYRLGQVMGDRLFNVASVAPWRPAGMAPLPQEMQT